MASLGSDAVPALLAGLGQLGPAQAVGLRAAVCGEPPGRHTGAAFNLSGAAAASALARACG